MSRRLLFIVLVVVTGADFVDAQRQGGARQGAPFPSGRGPQPTGTAVIQGRVLAADTGAPVRRAQVRAVLGNGAGGGRVATTDAEGRYELRDLPGGRWRVTASKGGFVTQQYGQRRPAEIVEPLDIADGQRRTADFLLPRGGAISGHVFDEFGDPVTGARVQVLRLQMVEGQRRLMPGGANAQTDDRGAYRLYGLPPGDFYVSATFRAPAAAGTGDDTAFAPTYYPGTAQPGDAHRISLGWGDEQPNVNFTLTPVRVVQISGRVSSSSGAPVSATLTLASASPLDEFAAIAGTANAARSGPDGRFTFANVVPGTYVLSAMSRGRNSTELEVASVPLVVGHDDLADVNLVTTTGATIVGAVNADGAALPGLAGVQIVARSIGPAFGRRVQQSTISADGTFRVNGLIGQNRLQMERVPAGWMVDSITVGGVDVTDGTIELRGTEQLPARVVLTNRVTSVTGAISSRGQPSADATVILYADDSTRWTFPTRYVRTARPQQEGTFTVQGLPAGRYLAVALDYLQQGEADDPEFLDALRPRATSFSLNAGEHKALDLRLVQRP